jgi:hypothetical protein
MKFCCSSLVVTLTARAGLASMWQIFFESAPVSVVPLFLYTLPLENRL